MASVSLELPAEALSALRLDPSAFVREMRFAAAIYWYERGELSQAAAARVAGLERLAFLDLLADRKADVFLVDLHDLQQEVARG